MILSANNWTFTWYTVEVESLVAVSCGFAAVMTEHLLC